VKVLMLRNPAAVLGCQLKEGETGDVPGTMGRRLVALGIAQGLDSPKHKPLKKVEAIPPPPVEAVPPEPIVTDKPAPSPLAKPAKPSRAKPKAPPKAE